MARASALQAEGRRFDSVYLHLEASEFQRPLFCVNASNSWRSGVRAQRKIPVDLHFIVRLRHKASGAALGLSCAVCFEQPAGVFTGKLVRGKTLYSAVAYSCCVSVSGVTSVVGTAPHRFLQ